AESAQEEPEVLARIETEADAASPAALEALTPEVEGEAPIEDDVCLTPERAPAERREAPVHVVRVERVRQVEARVAEAHTEACRAGEGVRLLLHAEVVE